jgi:hypothetical protein
MDRRRGPGCFKCKFTPEEDLRLRDVIDRCGSKDWSIVACHMYPRNARQCRERWTNYINPAIQNIPWTPEEEALLEQKFTEFGTRWQIIAAFFPKRSKNHIKNHWLSRQKVGGQTARHEKPIQDQSTSPDVRPITSQTPTLFDILFSGPGKEELFWQELATGYF